MPFSDLPAVAKAAEDADSLLLFYGTNDRPLPAVLQLVAEPLRKRRARVVAVLHKDTASQRDDCFRAGASDVLFMPMPKDSFRQRLVASVGLQAAEEPLLPCAVSVAEGAAEPRPLDGSQLSLSGVRGKGLAASPGDTVRLSLVVAGAPLQVWGLVAPVQGELAVVRFAGLSHEEDLRVREFLKAAGLSAGPPQASCPPAAPAAPAAAAEPAAASPSASAPALPSVSAPASAPASAPPPPSAAAPAPSPGAPAPVLRVGPPPGFAARPPIRPQTARPTRPPPVMAPAGSTLTPSAGVAPVAPAAKALVTPAPCAPAAAPIPTPPLVAPVAAVLVPPAPADPAPAPIAEAPAAATVGPAAPAAVVEARPEAGVPSPAAPAAGVQPAAAGDGLAGLFDEGSNPAVPALPAGPQGPLWPGPIDLALCKAAVTQMLKDRELPSNAPPDLAAAARKVAGGLSSVEREALEHAGPDSHLYEALHARMALALANVSAGHLFASQPPAVVSAPALSALVLVGDTAARRLQGEADQAIAKGEVESLQMITAASSALSREQLSLKETADRLRGIAAAPRLGAGALDPDVQIAGQQPKAVQRKDAKEEVKQARAELRDFVGLDETPKAERNRRALLIGAGVLAVSLLNVLWFSNRGARPASQALLERAGTGVVSISVADKAALVTVTKAWLLPERRAVSLRAICEALHSEGIQNAALLVDGAGAAGQINVKGGCIPWGLPGKRAETPRPADAPKAPPQPVAPAPNAPAPGAPPAP